jgi:hypothetical protein
MEKSMLEERTYVILMIFTLKFITQLMLDHLIKCKENTALNMLKKLEELLPRKLPKKLPIKENIKELMEIKPLTTKSLLNTTETKIDMLRVMEEINT